MDVSKLRAKDLLNPAKWRDFAAGHYYERAIGFHKCEQLVYLLSNDQSEEIEKACTLGKKEWNAYKLTQGIVGVVTTDKIPPSLKELNDTLNSCSDKIKKHFKDVPIWFAEQAVHRSISCRPCLLKGSCAHCGCTTPENFMAPMNTCSGGLWQKFYDKEIWPDVRNLYKFDIQLKKNES